VVGVGVVVEVGVVVVVEVEVGVGVEVEVGVGVVVEVGVVVVVEVEVALTKTQPKLSTLQSLALHLRGDWWWADELDNPFGEALLVCPHPEIGTDGHERVAYAELYTVKEAKTGTSAALVAKNDRRMPYARVGWTIFKKDRPTTWTLPWRFEYDNLMPRIECRLAQRLESTSR